MRILLAVTQVWPLFLNFEATRPLTAASRSAELKMYRFFICNENGIFIDVSLGRNFSSINVGYVPYVELWTPLVGPNR
jgi:hypothetical protein